MDTGAEKTVIGKQQALSYCKYMGVKFKSTSTKQTYILVVGAQRSVESIIIRIPTQNNPFLAVSADVVTANIPFLVGLDILDKYSLVVNTYKDTLDCPPMRWNIFLVRKIGHLYLEWGSNKIQNRNCRNFIAHFSIHQMVKS